jgi:hypothetical protein
MAITKSATLFTEEIIGDFHAFFVIQLNTVNFICYT